MKGLSRESWLAIGLFVVLLVVTVVAAAYQTQGTQRAPPLASYSPAPDGAYALWLWLQAVGYRANDKVVNRFAIPEDTGVALVLEPIVEITSREWQTIDGWVEAGGTLVVAGERLWTAMAAQRYGFSLRYLAQPVDALAPQTPLMVSPPFSTTVQAHAAAWFAAEQDQTDPYVVHLAVDDKPVMMSLDQGAGRVILCAVPYVFTNAGLKEEGNPVLALNAVTAAKRPGSVWFDEWHHGRRGEQTEIVGPSSWLRRTPAGRALLYAAAIGFFALLLSGRRFGRPVPLVKSIIRRAPLEYITAIANLSLRAGHRAAVLRRYHHQLKRELGRRYRLDPTLHDGEYVARLQALDPGLDAEALHSLLARLRADKASEGELIQAAAEVAEWLKEF